jgi:hypothetical protein
LSSLFGFRELCFVVGSGVRSIENTSRPTGGLVKALNDKEAKPCKDLEAFYWIIVNS